MPCSSAAVTISPSRTDPPGWTTAATPASASTSSPSRNGKKASLAATAPRARCARLPHGELGRLHPALLTRPDAQGLPVGGDDDGVGRRPGTHPPRQLDVAPLVVGGGRLGGHLPVRTRRGQVIGVLDQEARRPDCAAPAQRRCAAVPRAAAWPCAGPPSTSTAPGSNDDATITSAWGPSATAWATSTVHGPPRATTPPKADTGSHSRAEPVGVGEGRRRGRRRTGWRA